MAMGMVSALRFRVTTETNGLSGIEASVLVQVVDQHGITHDHDTINRDAFDNSREFNRAIERAVSAFKTEWVK